jgi:agmatinase
MGEGDTFAWPTDYLYDKWGLNLHIRARSYAIVGFQDWILRSRFMYAHRNCQGEAIMRYPEWEVVKAGIFDKKEVPMISGDMPTFMRIPYAESPRDLVGADVVIIGSTYVSSAGDPLWGVSIEEWAAAPKRVRQQSARYSSGYIADFDLDIFEHLKLVDYGDAEFDRETFTEMTYESVMNAQRAMEKKVNDALDVGAIPIVIGQNSPCSSYAIAKPIAERVNGNVGVISLDTHWDIEPLDEDTEDPRIAGAASWKAKMYEFHDNMKIRNLIEIGERGMLEYKENVRNFLSQGAHFYPMWKVRQIGIANLCEELSPAYDGTESVYVHFDMDVLGGAGPAPGDLLGDLAEPLGMTDYEVIRLAYEIGRKGFDALSFLAIPPGSCIGYRTIVYVIMYMLAGKIMSGNNPQFT